MKIDRKSAQWLMLIIAFALILAWGINNFVQVKSLASGLFSLISPFILGFCFAFVLNILLRPLERVWDMLFAKKKGKWKDSLRRPVCLVLSILLLFGAVSIIFFVLVPQLRLTVMSISEKLPQSLAKVELWLTELYNFLNSRGLYAPALDLDTEKIIDKVSGIISQWGGTVVNKTLDITVSIFSLLFNIILALIISIYILSQKEHHGLNCRRSIYAIMKPEHAKRSLEIISLANRSFTNYVTGQVTDAVILGCLCCVGMLIFNFPYALVVSVVIAFSALIPIFGAWIGGAIGAFLILFVSPMQAFWFIVFLLILQQLEGNLIYPKVVGTSVGLPGIWVLAAVTIGGGLFGIVGMLIGVPVCAVIYTLGKEFVQERTQGIEGLE